MAEPFLMTRNTPLFSSMPSSVPITRTIQRMVRDLEMTLSESSVQSSGCIRLAEDSALPPEAWTIQVTSQEISVCASDELGAAYALAAISERWLGVKPFWFWMDQKFPLRSTVSIPVGGYQSSPSPVRFRGWFINDEIFLDHWQVNGDALMPWEMALEALIRCGGNLVIPGTGTNAHRFTPLAQEYGLWITHHHAEPLGAVMFARAYPDLKASYAAYPELFDGLWQDAIQRQKGQKVIFSLGFRGQGDIPFWDEDTQYNTSEARGKLISDLIQKQYQMVRQTIPNAVCCTNLYGEILELYNEGYIELPDNIIRIWGDNGFGKMVSRRQSNKDERVPALPEPGSTSAHGIYYHVSFYDLQAANVSVMLPNSINFVRQELGRAYARGVHDLLLVNCSNIRPHVFLLDTLRRMWQGDTGDAAHMAACFTADYFPGTHQQDIADCFLEWPKAMPAYGPEEDQHAGEQLYSFNIRNLGTQWMTNAAQSCERLWWATGKKPLGEQIQWLEQLCIQGLPAVLALEARSQEVCSLLEPDQRALFAALVPAQAGIILHSMEGCIAFGKSWRFACSGDYMRAFYHAGLAAEYFDQAEASLRDCEYGIWKGFAENECYTDCRYTAHFLRVLMGWLRTFGEGPDYYEWQWQLAFPPEDRRIRLMSNLIRRIDDQKMLELMKATPYQQMD